MSCTSKGCTSHGGATMTTAQLREAKDKDIPASLVAIQRAARMAKEQAVLTGTDIVIVRDEKTLRITAEQLRQAGQQQPF